MVQSLAALVSLVLALIVVAVALVVVRRASVRTSSTASAPISAD